MEKTLENLCERCKQAIEDAAYNSYSEGSPESFEGCSAMVDLDNDAQIEITSDRRGLHEVCVYHHNGNETPRLERYIKEWLDARTDEPGQWQEAYDNDDWRDVDPGCDPAFPHYGDFERWAYGWR